jgi:hypothetical protein
VKASIYSHSKLICKDGFLLNAKLIGNQDSKMDVVFENEFLEHRLGFSFQTLVQKRGTPEERGIKKVKLYN